jgi:transcription elongation factor Elf1
MNGEIKRTFECCRCGHRVNKRATQGFSLNCDLPSDEARDVFAAGRLGRMKCSECGSTMHPDERTLKRLAKYSFAIGSATVI